jgi:hypothetical protein
MEDVKILWQKIKHLYKVLCQEEWNPIMTGVIVGLLSYSHYGLVAALGCGRSNP